jgi:hypothetical protein
VLELAGLRDDDGAGVKDAGRLSCCARRLDGCDTAPIRGDDSAGTCTCGDSGARSDEPVQFVTSTSLQSRASLQVVDHGNALLPGWRRGSTGRHSPTIEMVWRASSARRGEAELEDSALMDVHVCWQPTAASLSPPRFSSSLCLLRARGPVSRA